MICLDHFEPASLAFSDLDRERPAYSRRHMRDRAILPEHWSSTRLGILSKAYVQDRVGQLSIFIPLMPPASVGTSCV